MEETGRVVKRGYRLQEIGRVSDKGEGGRESRQERENKKYSADTRKCDK